ncbi:hypothetical protein ACFWXB_13865 [Tsukamurella tyrosinosolvens]|uniref:hypothetical protein n=1 Tax=Tsukamurella tyrosinosolvens TaxID=57704 RepID=UPI002DD43F13|nr:hypothetical protein [Tsukamurella tyrosinosolvens]MEC4612883.1 hypothetical protein [Tsukamurella tyrosinosolvens]
MADIVTAIADQLDAWAREGTVYGTVQPDQIEVLLDQGNLVEARLTGFPSRPEVLSPTVLTANARYVAPSWCAASHSSLLRISGRWAEQLLSCSPVPRRSPVGLWPR